MNTTTSTKPASEKQIAYLESLRASRTPDVDATAVREWAQQAGSSKVSAKIDQLKVLPKVAGKAQQQHAEEPEDGIYIVKGDDAMSYSAVDRQDLIQPKPDQIFKVYKMVHGSGRQGVKRLEHVDADAAGDNRKGEFKYLGLAVKHLPAGARKMTLEEAKKFGRIYGFCVRCGATLTDDDSIAAGIGPICSGKWA